MIYTTIKQLPKKFNLIKTKKISLENEFDNFKIFDDFNFESKEHLDEYSDNITLDPEFYFNNYKDKKIDLFVISVDPEHSYYLNIARYIKTNKINEFIYNNKYFVNFLIENFPSRLSRWKIINLLNKLKISISKYYILEKIWIPKFYFKENIFKGKTIGKGDYNCYLQRSKKFNEDFKVVYNNLSDEDSQRIYKDIVYSKPSVVWKNYFNNLKSEEHYQHHLKFEKSNIINFGVELGFEIPFFLANNLNSIINVDPFGNENLHNYVKLFIKNYEKIVFFEKSFLYDSSRIETKFPSSVKCVSIEDIINKYKLEENIIIKSDIEGLELKMLDELPKIIDKFRPQLAISIYHLDFNLFPNHSQLTLIPKNLMKVCKNYKFYIKHYAYNRGETVFYCIPN